MENNDPNDKEKVEKEDRCMVGDKHCSSDFYEYQNDSDYQNDPNFSEQAIGTQDGVFPIGNYLEWEDNSREEKYTFPISETSVNKATSVHKAIKVRLYPNSSERELLNKSFGCCRLLWNQMLAERNDVYQLLKEDSEATVII